MWNDKRGESLVEVLVALSIIMLIFAGVVSMIAGSVTLNLSARQRTTVVAMVQKNLNEFLAKNSSAGVCAVTGLVPPQKQDETFNNCSLLGGVTDSAQPCYWMEISTLGPDVNEPLGVNDTNFVKIISHGKWYTRMMGEQEFQVGRLVRKK